jgi:hypothetical protein
MGDWGLFLGLGAIFFCFFIGLCAFAVWAWRRQPRPTNIEEFQVHAHQRDASNDWKN